MKARVNPDTCTGCELCVTTCPEVFSMTDDGLAIAIDSDVPSEYETICQEAADDCPAEAIDIV